METKFLRWCSGPYSYANIMCRQKSTKDDSKIIIAKIEIMSTLLKYPIHCLVALTFFTSDNLYAQQEQSELAKNLIGSWVYDCSLNEPNQNNATGNRLKFITEKHWNITQADPKTGVTIFHHGGTFSLDGNILTSTTNYANQNTSSHINTNSKFKVEVDGDTMTQIEIDNNYSEVWKRAE